LRGHWCTDTKESPSILWNPKDSLLHSQDISACPHPEPDESGQYPPPNFVTPKSILILSTHHLGLPSGPSLRFPTNNLEKTKGLSSDMLSILVMKCQHIHSFLCIHCFGSLIINVRMSVFSFMLFSVIFQ
jgi:hypothetical protein